MIFSFSYTLVHTLITCIVFCIAYYVYIYINVSITEPSAKKYLSSSVWCQIINNGEKKCSFQNLFYSPKHDFLFVLTNKSVISGLNQKEDFRRIKTSSVINHNGMFLKISIVFSSHPMFQNIKVIDNPIFLLWRFKPDNIMHVIHDDLLPLYLTYTEICAGNLLECTSKFQLAYIDEFSEGPLSDWYKIFSSKEPILLRNLNQDTILCFKSIQTGLRDDSLFFQYGFNIPQGPVKAKISFSLIRSFADFIISALGIKNREMNSYKYSFLSRQLTRKILNEDFIEHNVAEIYNRLFINQNLIMEKLDFSFNSTKKIIESLYSSRMIIGMHGSAMILAMFMPEGSTVVELFPFGINFRVVSPVHSMCQLPGMYLNYIPWTNENENNSYPHPEYPNLWGGIYHLSKKQQADIINTKEIPAVKCCHNPYYLYRMFQDTVINNHFVPILEKALISSIKAPNSTNDSHLISTWFFPGHIYNPKCYFSNWNLIRLSWDNPINIEKFQAEYRIIITVSNQNYYISTNSNIVDVHLNEFGSAQIWIVCVINGDESFTTFVECPN